MLFNKLSVLATDEHSSRPTRLIIGSLVFVLTLVLSGTLALNHFVEKFSATLNHHLVFEVDLTGMDTALQNPLLRTLQQTMNAFPVVKESMVVLPPSPKSPLDMNAPPSLAFMDATVTFGASFSLEELLSRLRRIHPGIHLQSNQFIQESIYYFCGSLKFFSYGIIVLLSLAILIAISLTAKSTIKMQSQVMDILRLIGATHSYVAKQFQWTAFRIGFFSSFLGVSVAILTFFLAISFGTYWGFSEDFVIFDQKILISFILLPLLVALISLFIARFEVIRTLIRAEQ